MAKKQEQILTSESLEDQDRTLSDESETIPDDMKDLPIDPGSYQAAYDKAKKAGRLHKKTYQIHVWESDGDELIGKVINVSDFTGGDFDNACKQYLMETDQGLRSFLLGSWTDRQLEADPILNRVVRIYYSGRKDIEGGRKVNLFDIDYLD